MDTKEKNFPLCRFPEFQVEGGWKTLKLKDITNIVNEKCGVNFLCPKTYISTENMLPNFGGIKVTSGLPTTGTFTRFQNGDILFSNIRPYLKKVWQATFDGVASNDIIVFRPQDGFNMDFIFHVIKSDAFIFHSMIGAKGVKMPRGDKDLMLDFNLYVPNSDEQRKIAECLSSIDTYIISVKEKIEQLKEHKKSLLQKLFPQNGKTVPEYRFPEFKQNGEWKRKSLKEVIKVNSGRDYKHLDAGNIPVYGTGGYMLSVSDKLSDCDAVGIGRKGTIDKPQYLKAPFWTVDTLFFLTAKNDYDTKFIYYFAQNIPWRKYGEQTGVPSLSKISIENLEVIISENNAEQTKIAQIMSSLDKELSLFEMKKSLLEKHKSGLEQQLFPQNNGYGL